MMLEWLENYLNKYKISYRFKIIGNIISTLIKNKYLSTTIKIIYYIIQY